MSIETRAEYSVFDSMEPTEYERSLQQLQRLDETIVETKHALSAPDFNEGDRKEVENNLVYFELRRAQLEQALAFGSLLSTQRGL